MAAPTLLQDMMRRPGMYFSPVEFDSVIAFLQGFNLACHGGALLGFREWLVVRLGNGNNLCWSALVLELAFPEAENPREQLLQTDGQKQAVRVLFSLLNEFMETISKPVGHREIFLRYQTWLMRQDWYVPSSPDYLADPTSPG